MALITLLTDFGLDDEYVGVMKGVIAGIHEDARVVDITHQIGPQDVVHGAFILAASFSFFPRGSIHVAVVDPGVGSKRRILAVETGGHRFLAPDNGLMERVLIGQPNATVVSVENERFFLKPVSATFHGRDVFAPVSAHLAKGVPLHHFGPRIDCQTLVAGVLPRCRFSSMGEIEGQVVAIDRFGNLLTNIDNGVLGQLQCRFPGVAITVRLAGKSIQGLSLHYAEGGDGALLAMVGSRGLLEISINGDSAHRVLGAHKNDRIRVSVIV